MDTGRLLLVPGLFNRRSLGGQVARTRSAGSWTRPRKIVSDAVKALEIARHALIETLRQALAVLVFHQKLLVGGIAQEGDFGQHRWHIRASQHHERRAVHAAVPRA